jgi:hypothetical protein
MAFELLTGRLTRFMAGGFIKYQEQRSQAGEKAHIVAASGHTQQKR